MKNQKFINEIYWAKNLNITDLQTDMPTNQQTYKVDITNDRNSHESILRKLSTE